MSTNHYDTLSSGEEELVIDEAPKRKRVQKRKLVVESDEEVPTLIPTIKKKSREPSEEQKWQQVMEVALKFMVPLKVDTKALTMLMDNATLECFKKACQAWLNEKKMMPCFTFTTQKSFITAMARFVFDFTLKYCNLEGKNNVNVSGAVIWEHECLSEPGMLRCFHGTVMLQKEQIIEMPVTSENGQKALKDNPQKAKITVNNWGRNVVQLKNSDAVVCPQDANCQAGSFSAKSCGLAFTEASKALQAFQQIMAYQSACYPKMPGANARLLLPIKCDCNYLNIGTPLLGRQLCKITPFSLNNMSGLDEQMITDPTILASVKNPSILVFQCCNPVYKSSRASAQKNCDFKISAPDFIGALQLAKKFWATYFDTPAPITIPEFKWGSQYQYQNSILPTPFADADERLF